MAAKALSTRNIEGIGEGSLAGALAMLLQLTGEAVVVFDGVGRVLLANDAASNMLCHGPGIVGADVRLLFPPPERNDVETEFSLAGLPFPVDGQSAVITCTGADGSPEAMETLFNATSWSYSHLPDHITKWVAWRFLVFWGFLGLVWYRAVMPVLLYRIGMLTSKRQLVFVLLLTVYLVADIFMTVACFNRKTERDAGVPAQNAFEVWVDNHYTDEFIASRFQNLVIGDSE